MADDKPRPKPGSLRDRIAAFEAKPADTPPPPAPRPKPGHVQWKPRTASPPSSPPRGVDTGAGSDAAGGRMSATDAKEVIGGSLKERMAALQGRGAFGAPAPAPPPPRPAGDRPKWKPPVQPVHSPEHEEGTHSEVEHGKVETGEGEEHTSPTAEHAEGEAHHGTEGDEAEQATEPDDEEEERKRRAAIAARMARLGGARFGMGAPPSMFGAPKPQPKSVRSESSEAGSVQSPPAGMHLIIKVSHYTATELVLL